MNIDILELAALGLVLVFYAIIWYLRKKKDWSFTKATFLAVGLGVIVGLAFKNKYTYYSAFGTIYTRLISAIVVPLLFFSIISSITNLTEKINLKKIGLKSVGFLLLNTLIASTFALLFSVFFHIGKGFQYQLATNYKAQEVPSFIDTITNLFPSNLASHYVNGEIVPIVLFAIFVALAYNALIKYGETDIKIFKQFVDATNKILGTVVSYLIDYTPYAVLALIGRAISSHTLSDLLPLLSVLVIVYVLCAIQIFLVEGSLLTAIGKLNPIAFFKGIFPAGLVAFTSQSSVGTIPVTTDSLKKLGVQEDIASFVASLGANLGMPGCAGIWPVVSAIFAINLLGIHYSVGQYIFLIVLTLVVAIGTVGVPGTATITATAVFIAAGLPVEVIVLLTPISSIADMARTATNVVGAATATVLVAKTENELDLVAYNQKNPDDKQDSESVDLEHANA